MVSFLLLLSPHKLWLHASFVWISLSFRLTGVFHLSSPSPLLFLLRSKGPFCPFSFLLSATQSLQYFCFPMLTTVSLLSFPPHASATHSKWPCVMTHHLRTTVLDPSLSGLVLQFLCHLILIECIRCCAENCLKVSAAAWITDNLSVSKSYKHNETVACQLVWYNTSWHYFGVCTTLLTCFLMFVWS